MYKQHFVTLALLMAVFSALSQEHIYKSTSIPEALKENANAVIRTQTVAIRLKSSREMHILNKRVVTVRNKKGEAHVNAFVYYDDNKSVLKLEAVIYDAFGKVIKKVKKKDFKDVSAVAGGTLYSDSRLKYLDYTPIAYPYTVAFSCETTNKNTAFIPPFYPIDGYNLSVEQSSYSITYPETLKIRLKKKNVEHYNLETFEEKQLYRFQIHDVAAINTEAYSPEAAQIVPRVLVASNKFTLEGVEAEVEDWTDFGKWMYRDLIADTHDVPESTVKTIKNLVKDEVSAIDKAKKIYQYVQDKVRYISVQVGIGGWKPFNASQVDKLGYGDCKALTNYTMALLNAVGVESHYTIVYANGSQRNIEKDFSAMQGNHAILNIPQKEGEDIWLECTSQKSPFGFIGNFTDDRDVLVITPEGGKIKHTKQYKTKENSQVQTGCYTLSSWGDIAVTLEVNSKGTAYDDKYYLESYTPRDKDIAYKKRLHFINTIDFQELSITNDKAAITFKEVLKFTAKNYAKKAGSRLLFRANAVNQNKYIPKHDNERRLPVVVKRGYLQEDDFVIKIPENYQVESVPKAVHIENKFGSYSMHIAQKNTLELTYKRLFILKDGVYPKEDYKAFRDFWKHISKQDAAKIVIVKKTEELKKD